MRKFLIKLLFFFTPIFLVVYYIPKIYYLDKGIDKGILGKFNDLYPLVKNTKCIVIAGDSRAERQINPFIIEKETGIKTINIAVSSGELISFIPYLKYFNPDSTSFIFSTSSWQINDGAVSFGYLSLDAYVQLNLFQRLKLYRNHLSVFISMEDRLIRSTFKDLFRDITSTEKEYHYDSKIIKNKGFMAFHPFTITNSSNEKVKTTNKKSREHPWYVNLHSNRGYRNRLFINAINELGNSKFDVFIYQPPVSKDFLISNKNGEVGQFERLFSKQLLKLAKKHKNIKIYDFYRNPLNTLDKSDFYDPQHLNSDGAKKFSSYIVKKIF